MAVTAANPSTGTIQGRSSMSMATWGENIQVLLRPEGDAGTQVEVTSSLKFGLVDWGRNRSNVNRIHEAIGLALAQPATSVAGPPAAWHPDPYGRHEHRWWDGMQWTASVSDQGVVATDPPPPA